MISPSRKGAKEDGEYAEATGDGNRMTRTDGGEPPNLQAGQSQPWRLGVLAIEKEPSMNPLGVWTLLPRAAHHGGGGPGRFSHRF